MVGDLCRTWNSAEVNNNLPEEEEWSMELWEKRANSDASRAKRWLLDGCFSCLVLS